MIKLRARAQEVTTLELDLGYPHHSPGLYPPHHSLLNFLGLGYYVSSGNLRRRYIFNIFILIYFLMLDFDFYISRSLSDSIQWVILLSQK